jgi:hypothetical protein
MIADVNNITLETDELGIWLVYDEPIWKTKSQVGHISWHEITKRIQQQLLQEKFMLVLAELDEGALDE